MKKDGKRSTFESLEGNFSHFTEEFIAAGPRLTVIGLFRKLRALNAEVGCVDMSSLYSKNAKVVLLCINEGTGKGKYGKVYLKNRAWWDYWHNPKHKRNKPAYKTYNVPKQMSTVLNKLVINPIELIIPE